MALYALASDEMSLKVLYHHRNMFKCTFHVFCTKTYSSLRSANSSAVRYNVCPTDKMWTIRSPMILSLLQELVDTLLASLLAADFVLSTFVRWCLHLVLYLRALVYLGKCHSTFHFASLPLSWANGPASTWPAGACCSILRTTTHGTLGTSV